VSLTIITRLRLDAALYEPAPRSESLVLFGESASSSFHHFNARTRIRSLNVTLGTAVTYELGIWGTNLTSSIIYDSGALIQQSSLLNQYEASGTLLFTLTEDVVMTSSFNWRFYGLSPTNSLNPLYLDVNLQDDVGGIVQFGSTGDPVPVSFVELEGWTSDGFVSYETAPGSPEVDIIVQDCEHVYARLVD